MNSQSAATPLGSEFARNEFRLPLPSIPAGQREDVRVDELEFRRLRTAGEIARIRHLRAEIQLPASVLCDASFRALEKKETRTGSSARLNGAAPSLARSGWSP